MSYYMMDGAQADAVARSLTGFGYPLVSQGGFGYPLVSQGFYGFGAIDFNADTVWSDWLAGASGNNAAGARAAKAIQAGLNQLGYGPVTVDGIFGGGSKTAFGRFASDNGISLQQTGWPNKVSVIKMGELLRAGVVTGSAAPIESHVVGGEFVPGAAPGAKPLPGAAPTAGGVQKAGLSTGAMIGLGALALVAVGAIALMAKKKKEPARSARQPEITVTETIPRPHAKPITETVRVR